MFKSGIGNSHEGIGFPAHEGILAYYVFYIGRERVFVLLYSYKMGY
jgi:hypothetical protein